MLNIPLLVVWVAVLCAYLPYNMGFAFLNPMLILAYAFLSLLVGANLLSVEPSRTNVFKSAGAALLTILAGLVVVNVRSGAPELVLPNWEILLSAVWLSLSGALLMQGLSRWLARRGYEHLRVRSILRIGFAAIALTLYLNSYLPYDWKMWLAAHTTNPDLIRFAAVSGLLFVGTWRVTR